MPRTPLRRVLLALAALFLVLGGAAGSAVAAPGDPEISVRGVGQTAPGPGGVHVDWATGGGQPGRLLRVDGVGEPVGVGYTDGYGSIDLPGVPAGTRTVFRLEQAGLTEKLLATATVQNGKTTVAIISRATPPREVPGWVDRVMQIVPFATLALFAVLLGAYLWSVRRLRPARSGATVLAVLLTALTCASVQSAQPMPIDQQPTPDAREYADSAQRLADGVGFNTTIHGGVALPPRYSPGFPIALAPFAALKDFPQGVQLGASAAAIFYVLAVVAAAWALAGPVGGSFAALLLLFSPFARGSASLVMSDAFGAALGVLVLVAIKYRSAAGDRLSGALTGFAGAVRVLGGVSLIAALIVAPDRAARKRLVLWAAPFVVLVALLQWFMFGSPLRTGYDYWNAGFAELFRLNAAWTNIAPEGFWIFPDRLNTSLVDLIAPQGLKPGTGLSNVFFYLATMSGVVWVYLPPLIPAIGLIYGWRNRRDEAVRYALVTGGLTLLLYLVYSYQAARLVALPASLLLVLTAAGLARGVEWCRRVEVLWRERAAAEPPAAADDRDAAQLPA